MRSSSEKVRVVQVSKRALLQYCPTSNAKRKEKKIERVKYYKTAKNISAYGSKNPNKYQIATFPRFEEQHLLFSSFFLPPTLFFSLFLFVFLTTKKNIYNFKSHKNVKQTDKTEIQCGLSTKGAVYPFCAAWTCMFPKSSSSSSVRFRLPVRTNGRLLTGPFQESWN